MIPAGRTSFRVDLRQRTHLNLEDQATMATVRTALRRTPVSPQAVSNNGVGSTQNGHLPTDAPIPTYPFRVPSDVSILGARSVPDSCIAFFMAEGQIAFPNFCNPRYLACIFVVFNQLQVGLLWLDLRCFMPMYKVLNPSCS